MSNENPKTPTPAKTATAASKPAPGSAPVPASASVPGKPTPPALPGKVAPLFRKVDWLTFLVTFAGVMIGYFLTMAPELTLEDSGELATGSFYAGIPHPPGYPVWTIYTWLWTVLVPIKNIAWRVALGEAVGGALACGLLGLLVSRGSSLLMEGIEELKAMAGKWESGICLCSGFVAGMLLGYNGFMWSQSVIVEVYAFSVASFMIVLLCLLRWIYAPHQRRYLYWALFFHGISFTNHQTLIVAAMGLEVAIAAANYRMGRYLFLGNSIIYLAGLILKSKGMIGTLDQNPAVFTIFNVVGMASILTYFWFCYLSKETFPEFCLDAALTATFVLAATGIGNSAFFYILALAAAGAVVKFGYDTRKLGLEWIVVMNLGFFWIAGALFYFYMPLAGMTNPPMEWGYPRTVEGFIHAFTRGQYEKTNPSDVFGHPGTFLTQLGMLGTGIVEEFNWVYMFLALVPFLFFRRMHRRERAWMIGLTAIYFCLGVLLLILLNPPPDRQAQSLVRVFFGASHMLIALLIGYGLTLIAAFMATHYQAFRRWGLIGGGVAICLALLSLTETTSQTFFGQGSSVGMGTLMTFIGHVFSIKDQYGLPVIAGVILLGMSVAFTVSIALYRNRAPLAITLGLFVLMPLHSIMLHWSDNEQRGHWFGYWFGHDMFTPPFADKDGKPLYPEMAKDAVLYGGTDPGRFCPTYMIFCDSFVPGKELPKQDQKFDRRDVYIITQNALADGTYLNYIRAQYNRSTQIDPPFFQELVRSGEEREKNFETNTIARLVKPLDNYFLGLGDRIEKRRRTFTSWFTAEEFTDFAGFVSKLKAHTDDVSKFIYEALTPKTQQLLASSGNDVKSLAEPLCKDLNALLDRELATKKLRAEKQAEKDALDAEQNISDKQAQRRQQLEKEIADLGKVEPLWNADRFKAVEISDYLKDFIKQNPQSHTRVRLNRLLLEAAYPKEITKSKGGVYPDREIYSATPEDSQRCFQEYLQDAQRRLQANQLKPGEDVHIVENRVQVSGQVAVMAINGLLTKVIFDHNPKNEFYVEESFPLDWMYKHLTPFGVIMKINRQPLTELSEEVCARDHEFWKQFSKRLTGDFINYDTPIKEIAQFIERTYLRRDFTGFKGDRAFVRDDQAQKAFSKLRSSIGGIYAWRITDPENRDPKAQQRMIREAEFAFKQAFAFCPYSPEAVFRYVNLLLSMQRFDDALIIASTCQKLDPYNGQVVDLVHRLKDFQSQRGEAPQQQQGFAQLEEQLQKNPDDFQAAFNLASSYLQMGQTNRALEVLDKVVNNPKAQGAALRAAVQAYTSFGNTDGIQKVATKLTAMVQQQPTDFTAGVGLAEAYHALHQDQKANEALDAVIANPKVNSAGLLFAAEQAAQWHDYGRLEKSLERLVQVVPDSPEGWYDLAALKSTLAKTNEVFASLQKAVDLSNARLKKDPKARDLLAEAKKDPRFAAIRASPDFARLK
jgi:thioredoxin-like negative regulator of GroEL